MRINQWISHNTDYSRRKADDLVRAGRVLVNGTPAELSTRIGDRDSVTIDGTVVTPQLTNILILMNKPIGYVCSKNAQGHARIYDLLPRELQHLNPIGRLDKDSSGLLLLTNNGELLHKLAHPSYKHTKEYCVELNQRLSQAELEQLRRGVDIGDARPSILVVKHQSDNVYLVELEEGRNRQIRRSFEVIGKTVTKLHRTRFGSYTLSDEKAGEFRQIVVK